MGENRPFHGSLYTYVVLLFFPFFALAVKKSAAVFVFYHVHSTDLEEKIDGLWKGYFHGFFFQLVKQISTDTAGESALKLGNLPSLKEIS